MSEQEDHEFPDKELAAEDLTPFDIVELLKSGDGNEQAKALAELYPDQSVALVRCTHTGQISLAVPDGTVLPSLFTALAFACQRVGAAVGLELRWVQTPEQQQADSKRLVVPGNGPTMPPMR